MPALDSQVYRHMQLKIGQKEEKEGKPLDPQIHRHMQDNAGGV